jgi:hypothetical protein
MREPIGFVRGVGEVESDRRGRLRRLGQESAGPFAGPKLTEQALQHRRVGVAEKRAIPAGRGRRTMVQAGAGVHYQVPISRAPSESQALPLPAGRHGAAGRRQENTSGIIYCNRPTC